MSAGLRQSFLVLLLNAAPALAPAASLFNLTLPWDDASPGAVDSSSINSARAGSDGFVFVDGQGHFATSQGRLRFWGTNLTFGGAFPSYTDGASVAGRLAKFGFNIVRFHHMDNQTTPNGIWASIAPDRSLDAGQLDRLDYLIDQLAQKGIYTNLNLVVSRTFHPGSELDPSILGITDWKVRAVLGFFDPANLALQRQYATALLTHVNPYTGLAPKDDPAVAFVEVNNENGLVQAWMSGQLDGLPQPYRDQLAAQWNSWLTLKYGSHSVMEAAWGVLNQPLGAEKLLNPNFTNAGMAPWVLEQNGGAAANVTRVPDGAGGTTVARLTITATGTQGWHVQFNQPNLSVTAGAVYTLGFWAKASVTRTVNVDLMMAHAPWGGLGFSAAPALSTAWQYFEYTLSPNASDSNARINFGGMGLQTGQVWIGNVTFKPGGLLGLYPGEDLGSGNLRNFLNSGEAVARTAEAKKDWLRFLLATEQAYWLAMRDHLKLTLGCQNLVMGTQQGCSTPNLQAAFDAIDTHYYWRHPAFPNQPWDWVDWYNDNDAMVDDPAGSSIGSLGSQAVLGKPHSVTELNAPYPNTFEADVMLLTAAYAGLQDFDALYPFDYWGASTNWGDPSLTSFFSVNNNPLKMAGMAAAARAFRRGDFSPASQMVAVPLNREDEVTQLTTSYAWRLVNAVTAGEDGRAPLVHRVRMVVEGQTAPGGSLAPGTGSYGSVISSDTGQLRWDLSTASRGLVSGNSPRTQFAAGFFNGRSVALGSITVSAVDSLQTGEYALVSLSSSDHLDLSATASALLTVLGCQRNTGSSYYTYPNTPTAFPPAKGLDITLRGDRGSGPAQVEGVSATVTLGFASADVTVYALDAQGQRGASLPIVDAGGWAQVQVGPAYQALWYEVVVSRPAYSPTPTRTPTPAFSATATRTITPTPTPPSAIVWEDMETAAPPAAWQAYVDTSTGAILSVGLVTGTAVASGIASHEVRFNSGGPGNWGGALMVNSPYGTKPSLGWRDLSGMAVLEVQLWTDRAGLRVRPVLSEAGNTATAVNGADGEVFESSNGAWTVLPAGVWVTLQYPLAGFRDKPFWPYSPTSIGNDTLDLAAIAWVNIEWEGNQGAAITLRVDGVRFFDQPGTVTVSPTPSSTRSPSPTTTGTATASGSPTPSASGTPTDSPSPTFTGSPSFSETETPGPSPTESLTWTPGGATETPTLTPSPTASDSPTETETASPTTSATPTPSWSPAVTLTRTPRADPGGELRLRAAAPVPHPVLGSSLRFAVDLVGGAESLRLRLYSAAYTRVLEAELRGPFGAGWGSAGLSLPGLAKGVYFYKLEPRRGGALGPGVSGRLVVLE